MNILQKLFNIQSITIKTVKHCGVCNKKLLITNKRGLCKLHGKKPYNAQWRAKNKAYIRAYHKTWRAKNKERLKVARKKYEEAHKIRILQTKKAWRLAHPDEIRQYAQTWRDKQKAQDER